MNNKIIDGRFVLKNTSFSPRRTERQIKPTMEIHQSLEDKITLKSKIDCGRNEPGDTGNKVMKKLFSCLKCDKVFSRASNLKTHERLHTGEKPYSCSMCGKTFTRGDHLKAHM